MKQRKSSHYILLLKQKIVSLQWGFLAYAMYNLMKLGHYDETKRRVDDFQN